MRTLRNTVWTWALLAIAAMVVIGACNKTPTTPSFLPRSGSGSGSGTYTTRIEINGPASVPPGGTAQFTAIAHRSDGTTTDVTGTAVWRSSQPRVLSVAASGVATAVALGEANVEARFGALGSRTIFVLPDGTFRLTGLVTEADAPAVPVSSAVVEVIGGDASTSSGADGRYRLYGVPATATVRAIRDGYQPQTHQVMLADHATQNFLLSLAGPRSDLSGRYTLAVTVADECRSKLPEPAWTRTYNATIAQQGPLVEVALSGATFVVDQAGKGDGFRGKVEPGQALFTIDAYDYYYSRTAGDVVEEIASDLYLAVSGSVSASVAPGRITGALRGVVGTFAFNPSAYPPYSAFCFSADHRFALSR